MTPSASPRNWKELLTADRQAKVPLYHQISENFRELIRSGRLKSGESVPSEWELSDLYGVSRLTVRRALDELVRDGLLNRRQGVGTFVASSSQAQIFPSELSFSRNMLQIGRSPSSRVLSLQVVPATSAVAQSLELHAEAPVFQLVRIRYADGDPLMLETAFLPQQRFPDLAQADLSQGSLYDFLKTYYQVNIVALDQVMEPTLLTDREAELLGVAPASPAILSEIVGFTADGIPVEYTWSVTCAGRVRFYFHFREGDVGKRHFTRSLVSSINRE
jgi:GntR family transcriptional regulator